METDSNLILKDTEQITGVSENLIAKFQRVRKITEELCKPLRIEDYVVQPVVDVSPPKWHLAHTTWFFEELVLTKFKNEYRVFDKNYGYLFNSYYESVGERVLRPHRGFLTRPTVKEIYAFRKYVDDHMLEFLSGKKLDNAIRMLIELGLNHEQQHQELLITDLKYILGHNPLFPVYKENNKDDINKMQKMNLLIWRYEKVFMTSVIGELIFVMITSWGDIKCICMHSKLWTGL